MLNKRMGLSYGKVSEVLASLFGLQVSRGGRSQAPHRVAKKAEPTYRKTIQQVRGSSSIAPDETGSHPSDEDLSPGTPAGKPADSCNGCGSTQASK
jgi:hypothetical protein